MSLEDLTPQQRANLAAMDLLMSNPEVALQTKKLIKQLRPEARFADLETHEQIEASTAKLRAEQDKLAEQLNKDRLERQIAEQRAKLRADGVDVDALETFMKENELYSYDKALKIYRVVNKTATPTPSSLVQDMQEKDMEAFWKDPVKTARTEAENFFKERAQQRA
jgi:hypothetical protein